MAANAEDIPIRWGATAADWYTLSVEQGLIADLLPVVSNPNAERSPMSTLKAIGKVPSVYNGDGKVVGLAKWTARQSTHDDVKIWSNQPDYGVCIQTRLVRAVDVDVEDEVTARRVMKVIRDTLGVLDGEFGPDFRFRDNSQKFLLPFWMEGEHPKRILRLPNDAGIIEFLGNGQQFVAAGTHPSGSRYLWSGGHIPDTFLRLEPEEFEALWMRLRDELKAGDTRATATKTRSEVISAAAAADPVSAWLRENGHVYDVGRDGQLFVDCPNKSEHTSDNGPTQTAYYPAHTGGFENGHWHCLHAHCSQKADSFLTNLLDIVEYPDLSLEAANEDEPVTERTAKFKPVPLADFLARSSTTVWRIKHVLPATGVATVYGPSGGGKSFSVIDLLGAIATGTPWQGNRTTRGRVVYLAAEGQGGVARRLHAWCLSKGIDPASVDLQVIDVAPNMMERADAEALAAAVGECAVLAIDTLAASTPGADENSSQDMGRVMKFAHLLVKSTGGVVLLVHHAGKDLGRGQRGWSGLKGALDAEFEVARIDEAGELRQVRLSKVRDGPKEGARWCFKLVDVELGYDEEGDRVTSAVCEWVEPPAGPPKGQKLSDLQQLVVEEATNLIALGADATESDLVAKVVARIPTPSGRDTRPQSVKRSIVRLARLGVITFENDVVALP